MSVITEIDGLLYCQFNGKLQDEFNKVSKLISCHLLEPYSIYVYWFFLNTWPQYCYVVRESADAEEIVGVIISKVESHREVRMRGYIGMLVIDPVQRGKRIGTNLVKLTIERMIEWDAVDEVMLETEVINSGALRLYESLGFIRSKRLYRYYLNTHDAFRLILPISQKSGKRIAFLPPVVSNESMAA